MDEKQRQKIISELKDFYKKLKSYNRYVCSEEQLSQVQIRYRDSLREKLERQSGALKGKLIELTETQYAAGPLTGKFDIWTEAFNATAMSADRHALAFCISAVNEAIGKLESDIQMGIRDKHGNVIGEPQKLSSEPPKAFIAHEGETRALTITKEFLEALGIQYFIAESKASNGRSIEGQVNWTQSKADFAICLATKGKAFNKKTGKYYMAPNISDELGRARQVFGNKIILLVQKGVEVHTNIREIVYETFTTTNMEKSFIKIARELTEMKILKAVKPQRRGVKFETI